MAGDDNDITPLGYFHRFAPPGYVGNENIFDHDFGQAGETGIQLCRIGHDLTVD
jgi:hypothetical protein